MCEIPVPISGGAGIAKPSDSEGRSDRASVASQSVGEKDDDIESTRSPAESRLNVKDTMGDYCSKRGKLVGASRIMERGDGLRRKATGGVERRRKPHLGGAEPPGRPGGMTTKQEASQEEGNCGEWDVLVASGGL